MSTTVIVAGDYTVGSGQTINVSDPWTVSAYHAGFVLQAASTNLSHMTFELDGTLNVANNHPTLRTTTDYSMPWNDVVFGLEELNGQNLYLSTPETTFAAASLARIGLGGSLNVTMAAGSGQNYAYGYYSAFGYVPFENDGAIAVTNQGSANGYGVAMGASAILPFSGSYAPVQSSAGVLNRGSITVTASYGAGVILGDGASLTNENTGSITAHGGANGVQVTGYWQGGGPTYTVANSGNISADGFGNGIEVDNGHVVITNSGVITAAQAILSNNGSVVDLTNTGTVNGGVFLVTYYNWQPAGSFTGAQIHNTGAINGYVSLLDNGNDLYDGRGGTLTGALTVGYGHTTIYLGDDGETVSYAHALNYEGSITLLGGSGNDTVSGGDGNDLIDGGAGNDFLNGTGGVDTVSYASATSGVTVSLALQVSGQNTVGAGIDTLLDFENLTGSAYADHLTGDSGNNIIDGGGGGNDVMDGGLGANTASFASAQTGVTVSLALQGSAQTTGVGNDTLTNFQNLTGSASSDHLTGDSGANVIDGGSGGDDVLDGGGGVNTVSFASATAGVAVSLLLQGAVQNTGSGSDTLTNFRNLTGSAYDDLLIGDSSNNVIEGGGGTDTVSYAAATGGVTINLWSGPASGAGVGSDTLISIESVVASAYNDLITAADASGRYDGGGGTNTVDFSHDPNGMTIDLAAGVASDSEISITLVNIQHVVGTGQNDRIIFGGGAEVAGGGAGADVFIVPASGATSDEITDFNASQSDKIDLAAVRGMHGIDDIKANATQSGADTILHFGNGATLKLDGIFISSLTADDFAFAPAPVADFNGDGRADLFWQNSLNGLVSAWDLNDTSASGVSLPSVGGWKLMDVGDFDGNGYTGDFLFRNPTTGMVNLWLDFNGQLSGADVMVMPNNWQIMGVADFNGDGKSDILWRDESYGTVQIWLMNGQQQLMPTYPGWYLPFTTVPLDWKIVGTGDFDGNGKAEILWRSAKTGELDIWNMGPTGSPAGVTVATVTKDFQIAGTGDFNGDGKTDILWRNPSIGQVVIWEMDGSNVTGWQAVGQPGPQWQVSAIADVNGDGKSDILWRDSNTGQVVTWVMDGFNVDHWGILGTAPGGWYIVNHHYDLV